MTDGSRPAPLGRSDDPTPADHDAVTRVALRRVDFGKDDAGQFLDVLAHLGIDPREVQARWAARREAS